MKLKLFFSTLLGLLFVGTQAQDKTTVTANSSEISDNLDLRAVASIFGDSKNLDDFENRLNDPKNQISNLDLNGDNQVDYLRVVESVEGNTHIIVVQSVLGRDLFQDVATLEVEKDSKNRVQVQVVGDVYMYGNNYIYEPVYVHTPVIYSYFWVPNYRPYCSTWYWGYYPSYYYAWQPFPIFRYRSHINVYINFNHHYNYVNYRRCQVAYNSYYGRRANGYERQYPTRSFASRNSGYTNRYELDKTRNTRTVGESRNQLADNGTRGNSRNETGTRATTSRDTRANDNGTRATTSRGVRNSKSGTRATTSTGVRANDSGTRVTTSRGVRSNENGTRATTSTNVRSNESGTRSNTSKDVRTADSPSRSNPSRENQTSSSRSNSNPRPESRTYAAQREQRMPSVSQRNTPQRSSEPRVNSGGNPSRGGGESGRSERR